MKRAYLLLTGLFFLINLFSQTSSLLKIEKIEKKTWSFYKEKDSTIYIEIKNNKEELIETRKYSDLSLNTEIGEWIEYYPNKAIKAKRYFENGFPSSIWSYYSKDGKLEKEINYSFNVDYFESKVSSDSNQLTTKSTGETMPNFKGDLMQFIMSQLSYDPYFYEKYKKTGIHQILVHFKIEKDGSLTQFKVNNYQTKILEKDAIRILKNSPSWSPALKNNEPVVVDMTIPVVYVY